MDKLRTSFVEQCPTQRYVFAMHELLEITKLLGQLYIYIYIYISIYIYIYIYIYGVELYLEKPSIFYQCMYLQHLRFGQTNECYAENVNVACTDKFPKEKKRKTYLQFSCYSRQSLLELWEKRSEKSLIKSILFSFYFNRFFPQCC